MNLQAWCDDDNTEYTAPELKEAIKEEHNSLPRTESEENKLLRRSTQTCHTDKMDFHGCYDNDQATTRTTDSRQDLWQEGILNTSTQMNYMPLHLQQLH
eukprot:5735133-Amphidinium_carterae.2